MDIHYKHPSPETYRLIPIHTVVIPYWLKSTIARYGINPVDIYDTNKVKDKLSLSDISLISSLSNFNYAEKCKWYPKSQKSPYLYFGYSTYQYDISQVSQQLTDINQKIDTISNIVNNKDYQERMDEIRSLLTLPDEMYQSQKENTSFYKIELTSNNFILITIEAGFLNVLEAREDAKRFFSDYLKARCACEAIHEVSKTDIFEWYLASLA